MKSTILLPLSSNNAEYLDIDISTDNYWFEVERIRAY